MRALSRLLGVDLLPSLAAAPALSLLRRVRTVHGLLALPGQPRSALLPSLPGHAELDGQHVPRALLGDGAVQLLPGLRGAEPARLSHPQSTLRPFHVLRDQPPVTAPAAALSAGRQ